MSYVSFVWYTSVKAGSNDRVFRFTKGNDVYQGAGAQQVASLGWSNIKGPYPTKKEAEASLVSYKFMFKTFWNSDTDQVQQERAHEMVLGLIALGRSEQYARALVESFQEDAFTDGEHEESFNNCGEDA